MLCVSLVLVFAWYQAHGTAAAYDFENYLKAGRGDLSFHFYAAWMLPVYRALAALPTPAAFALWDLANIAGVFAATRVLGGGPKAAAALLTYQLFYTLYYGNISGILLGGLALYAWGLSHRRWHWAGLGLTLTITKFQLGIPFGLILLLFVDAPWSERVKVALVPGLIFLLSLLVYPGWPMQTIETIQSNPPNDLGSISLWRWIGPYALLAWLPPLLLPLDAKDRLLALVATATLAMPYFQHTDLLALFVFPLGWLPFAGNLGFYLYARDAWSALWVLAIIPVSVYVGATAKMTIRRP